VRSPTAFNNPLFKAKAFQRLSEATNRGGEENKGRLELFGDTILE